MLNLGKQETRNYSRNTSAETVNPPALPSKVQILHPPPERPHSDAHSSPGVVQLAATAGGVVSY
jgi:hypothetical protein